MQGYEASKKGDSAYRRKSSCSYCGSYEHQVTHCPHVLEDWQSISKGIMPLAAVQKRGDEFPQWYSYGSNWGDWYKRASKAHDKQVAFKQRQQAKAAKKKQKRVSTCGFCGEEGHTRRNCPVQKQFLADVAVANRNYRQYIYDTLVVQEGLSTGAIVRFELLTGSYYNDDSETMTTLATKVNWDSINVLAERERLEWTELSKASKQSGSGTERLNNLQLHMKSDVIVTFIRDGVSYEASFYGGKMNEVGKNGRYHYCRLKLKSEMQVVSRAPQVLGEDWVNGYQDAFKHLTKKCTWAELTALNVDELVEKWKNWTGSE